MAKVGRPRKIRYQRPRGMRDLLPGQEIYFQEVFNVCKEVADFYGFKRIETPILEREELFTKGIGQTTEIVEKQMFVFKIKGGDVFALRPEGTAPIARAFIENGMDSLPKPVKLWHFGPFFRHEKPQAGRYRQFWQFGFEVFGEKGPIVDIQIIQIFLSILKDLKIKDLIVHINSIGDPKCRAHYKKTLVRFLKSYQPGFCSDCKKRLKKNPFRVLDCKQEKCQRIISQAPQIVDYLCKECRSHFREVLEFLDALEIPYRLNPYLVRGLDYYTKTVFEIFAGNPSADLNSCHIALAGGGRYDGLVKVLGGKPIPGSGAAAGVERIVELMRKNEFKFKKKASPDIFLIQLGNLAKAKSIILLEEFRKAKIPIYETLPKDSLRIQLGRANKLGARFTLIFGQKEALEEKIILRDMEKGTQKEFKLKNVVKKIKKELSSR